MNRYPGTEEVSVFHGRDIFAYTAARLAAGVITFEQVGPSYPVEEAVIFEQDLIQAKVKGTIIEGVVSSVSDPFGSIALNILSKDFKAAGYAHGEKVMVTLKRNGQAYFSKEVLYQKSFGFVAVGEEILFDSSTNYIELGINQGNFKETYQVGAGSEYTFTFQKI